MLVGIGFETGVGKSSVSYMLSPHLGLPVTSFALRIKNVSSLLYHYSGLRDYSYYEHNIEEKEKILPEIGKTPRQIWNQIGGKLKEIDPNIWTNSMPLNCIVMDVRLKNEYDWVRKNNGILIRVTRPLVTRPLVFENNKDMQVLEWDYYIQNNGSLKKLAFDVEELSKRILSAK
jgi:hypothetical protein